MHRKNSLRRTGGSGEHDPTPQPFPLGGSEQLCYVIRKTNVCIYRRRAYHTTYSVLCSSLQLTKIAVDDFIPSIHYELERVRVCVAFGNYTKRHSTQYTSNPVYNRYKHTQLDVVYIELPKGTSNIILEVAYFLKKQQNQHTRK